MDDWDRLKDKYSSGDGPPRKEDEGVEDEKPKKPMRLIYIIGGFLGAVVVAMLIYSQQVDVQVGPLPQIGGQAAEDVSVSSYNPLQLSGVVCDKAADVYSGSVKNIGARLIDSTTFSVSVNGVQVAEDFLSWDTASISPGATGTFTVQQTLPDVSSGSLRVSLPSGDSREAQFNC